MHNPFSVHVYFLWSTKTHLHTHSVWVVSISELLSFSVTVAKWCYNRSSCQLFGGYFSVLGDCNLNNAMRYLAKQSQLWLLAFQ